MHTKFGFWIARGRRYLRGHYLRLFCGRLFSLKGPMVEDLLRNLTIPCQPATGTLIPCYRQAHLMMAAVVYEDMIDTLPSEDVL